MSSKEAVGALWLCNVKVHVAKNAGFVEDVMGHRNLLGFHWVVGAVAIAFDFWIVYVGNLSVHYSFSKREYLWPVN